MTPYPVKNDTGGETLVPCGKCPECKKHRASAWGFRLQQEEKRSIAASFVTLTYDTTHATISDRGRLTLDKRHCQLFFKRLRKRMGAVNPQHPVKYYLAGEYGGKTWRPHYHIILFNVPNPFDIDYAWHMGSTYHEAVNPATIAYVLKYISKPKRIPQYRGDDRLPEFGLMSKGIGSNYLTYSMKKWHLDDITERMYCTTLGGVKLSMPRYYKDRIYNDKEREQIALHFQAKMAIIENKLIHNAGGYAKLKHIQKEIYHDALRKFANNQKLEKS